MKITSQTIQLNGPCGNLEAILDLPDEKLSAQYIAVNCHPHSLHGGSMTNKVVHTLSRAIAGQGIASLRFNFRGVNKSQGEYDEGIGEQQDLLAAVAWLKIQYPTRRLILSGFSFGSFVSALAARDLQPDILLSIAPPVKRFNFDGFQRPECDWWVIMGDQDELVEFSVVTEWIKSFARPPQLITMAGASHFFHGRLVELKSQVETIVQQLPGNPGNE